ncbi:MFS transporter [Actinomadura macra]|uniref:MFS transporter n=1 Tax=Actinomadura macra TaxID=46164 RepID=UPI0008295F2C|nr:MFS transporter [Actinomadura macra]
MRQKLGLLGDRDFRHFFLAAAVSQFGSQVSMLALPLAAVLALHASPFAVGVLAACETAAFLLVGLPAGAWVDRMRRRQVLVVSDLGRMAVLGSVPAAWALGVLSMPQLYSVALITGVLTVFFDVASQSYLPHLVGRDALPEGNTKLEVVRGVSQVSGPTFAGLAVQALTAPVAVLADAASFALSALFLRGIHRPEQLPVREPGARLRTEIMQGLRFVLGNAVLRPIAISTATFNLFAAITNVMLIVLLSRELRQSAGTIGLFFSVASAGGLAGALVATRISARLGQGPTIWLSQLATGLFGLGLPLAQAGWPLWGAAFAFSASCAAIAVYNITQLSLRQRLTPDPLLGRMNATMRWMVWGTLPLGGLAGGVLGASFSPRAALWVAAVGGLSASAPLMLSPLRTMRQHAVPAGPRQRLAPEIPD